MMTRLHSLLLTAILATTAVGPATAAERLFYRVPHKSGLTILDSSTSPTTPTTPEIPTTPVPPLDVLNDGLFLITPAQTEYAGYIGSTYAPTSAILIKNISGAPIPMGGYAVVVQGTGIRKTSTNTVATCGYYTASNRALGAGAICRETVIFEIQGKGTTLSTFSIGDTRLSFKTTGYDSSDIANFIASPSTYHIPNAPIYRADVVEVKLKNTSTLPSQLEFSSVGGTVNSTPQGHTCQEVQAGGTCSVFVETKNYVTSGSISSPNTIFGTVHSPDRNKSASITIPYTLEIGPDSP